MPMIKGISFAVFFPYVEQRTVTNSVNSPQIIATYDEPRFRESENPLSCLLTVNSV